MADPPASPKPRTPRPSKIILPSPNMSKSPSLRRLPSLEELQRKYTGHSITPSRPSSPVLEEEVSTHTSTQTSSMLSTSPSTGKTTYGSPGSAALSTGNGGRQMQPLINATSTPGNRLLLPLSAITRARLPLLDKMASGGGLGRGSEGGGNQGQMEKEARESKDGEKIGKVGVMTFGNVLSQLESKQVDTDSTGIDSSMISISAKDITLLDQPSSTISKPMPSNFPTVTTNTNPPITQPKSDLHSSLDNTENNPSSTTRLPSTIHAGANRVSSLTMLRDRMLVQSDVGGQVDRGEVGKMLTARNEEDRVDLKLDAGSGFGMERSPGDVGEDKQRNIDETEGQDQDHAKETTLISKSEESSSVSHEVPLATESDLQEIESLDSEQGDRDDNTDGKILGSSISQEPIVGEGSSDVFMQESNEPSYPFPLSNRWTLYRDDHIEGGGGQGSSGKGSALKEAQYATKLNVLGNFDTVVDFAAILGDPDDASRLYPSMLPQGSNVHLFKDGIKPMYEDPANQNGGRWTLVFRSSSQAPIFDQCWQHLVMALIGGHFPCDDNTMTTDGDEDIAALTDQSLADLICGAVASYKKGRMMRIQVWLSEKDEYEKINEVGPRLLDVLGWDGKSGGSWEFIPHHANTSSKGNKNGYVSLPGPQNRFSHTHSSPAHTRLRSTPSPTPSPGPSPNIKSTSANASAALTTTTNLTDPKPNLSPTASPSPASRFAVTPTSASALSLTRPSNSRSGSTTSLQGGVLPPLMQTMGSFSKPGSPFGVGSGIGSGSSMSRRGSKDNQAVRRGSKDDSGVHGSGAGIGAGIDASTTTRTGSGSGGISIWKRSESGKGQGDSTPTTTTSINASPTPTEIPTRQVRPPTDSIASPGSASTYTNSPNKNTNKLFPAGYTLKQPGFGSGTEIGKGVLGHAAGGRRFQSFAQDSPTSTRRGSADISVIGGKGSWVQRKKMREREKSVGGNGDGRSVESGEGRERG